MISVGSIELLSDVLERGTDLPPAVRGELRVLLARLLASAGADPQRRRNLYAQALADLDDRPDLKALAAIGLASPMTSGVPVAERRRLSVESLDLAGRIGNRVDAAFVLGKIVTLLMCIGDPGWRDVSDRLVLQTGMAPKHHLEVDAYCSVGWAACYPGHYGIAEHLLTAAQDAVARGSRLQELRVRSALALLDYCRGAWRDLPTTLDILTDELVDYAPARVDVEALSCCVALACGDATAPHQVMETTRRSEGLGATDISPLAVGALARLAVERSDAEATEIAWRLSTILENHGTWANAVRVVPALTQAITTVAGDSRRAGELVTRWERAWRDLDAPLAPAALDHARGFLAAHKGTNSAAAGHFLQAADHYEALQCPYEMAQARESAAVVLLPEAPATATPTLLAAVKVYQRLGARWDLDRVSRVARQYGISLPARHRGGRRGYGGELSPREHDVSRLAAMGLTNKQIANDLFLSPNTVKRHLAAAMRKLGVNTRTALSHRLADGEAMPLTKNDPDGS